MLHVILVLSVAKTTVVEINYGTQIMLYMSRFGFRLPYLHILINTQL